MAATKAKYSSNDKELLTLFNERNSGAFGEVYSLFYKELVLYTEYIFMGTSHSAEDVIHDVFFNLWDNKKNKFDSLVKIKSFILVSIKNARKNYAKHQEYVDKLHSSPYEANFTSEQAEVLEFEVYSHIDEYLSVLPEDNAKIFKLYLNHYSPKEIAEVMGYSIQTVYNKKHESVGILRKHLTADKFIQLLIMTI